MNLYMLRTWLDAKWQQRNDAGANLVEYMLLLVFIAVVVIAVVKGIGVIIGQGYTDASEKLGS